MKRNLKKLELPNDFASRLLDYEIQLKLSDRPSKQVVKNLIQLYSLGVEYYQSIRSHKYLYFQLKMNEIFTSASTLTAISEETPDEAESPLKKKMKSNVEEQKILAYQIKQKQQKLSKQVAQNTKESASVNTVKKIMNENDLKDLAQQQKIRSEIQNQDNKLKSKLQKRKSRLLFSKSFTANISEESQTRDSLFPQSGIIQNIGNNKNIKPLQVSFSSVINQNDSDEEADSAAKRRMSIISNGQGKKTKSELNLFQKIQN